MPATTFGFNVGSIERVTSPALNKKLQPSSAWRHHFLRRYHPHRP